MTRIKIKGGIVRVNSWGRLHVGNKYVFMDFHPYCGPTFYRNLAQTIPYEPVDENDPVWPEFDKWLTKYIAAKGKEAAKDN